MSSVGHLQPGTLFAEKFRVLRLLGQGGVGSVYEVDHEITRHRRALKLLHPRFREEPQVVARFLREASAAGRAGNPHIIETFDAGRLDTGEPYLVMELLEGETLDERLTRAGRLDLRDLCEIVAQTCDGVQAAHDAGIIHRDLKPANLFLTRREGAVFVKVLDFGISKFDVDVTGATGMTRDGMQPGTPYYMPPELLDGTGALDARSDVYALGVILYEGATGSRPFDSDVIPHLAMLVCQGTPVPVLSLRPDVPAELAALIARAMAKEASDRYPTASSLGAALRELASNDALWGAREKGPLPLASTGRSAGDVDTSPPGARSTAPPPTGRSRGAGIAVAILLGIGLATAAGFAVSARRSASAPLPSQPDAVLPASVPSTAEPRVEPPGEAPQKPPVVPDSRSSARSSRSIPSTSEGTPLPPAASSNAKSRSDEVGVSRDNPFR